MKREAKEIVWGGAVAGDELMQGKEKMKWLQPYLLRFT